MEKKKQVKFDIPAMTPEQVRDAIVQIPNLPVMYFNHSRIASSNFDLRIFFGQINITAKNQQSIVEQLCVIMTPEFAKMFMETLRTALDNTSHCSARLGKLRLHWPSQRQLTQD